MLIEVRVLVFLLQFLIRNKVQYNFKNLNFLLRVFSSGSSAVARYSSKSQLKKNASSMSAKRTTPSASRKRSRRWRQMPLTAHPSAMVACKSFVRRRARLSTIAEVLRIKNGSNIYVKFICYYCITHLQSYINIGRSVWWCFSKKRNLTYLKLFLKTTLYISK